MNFSNPFPPGPRWYGPDTREVSRRLAEMNANAFSAPPELPPDPLRTLEEQVKLLTQKIEDLMYELRMLTPPQFRARERRG